MAKKQRKKSITQEFRSELHNKLAIGEKRADAKKNNTDYEKIFSYNTLHTYQKHSKNFAKWVRDKYDCRSMEEARPFVEEYLNQKILEGCSASTIKTYACSICKAYGIRTTKLDIEFPKRERKDITRSRLDVEERRIPNKDVVQVAKHTGLRRSELTSLRPEQLKCWKGRYYIEGVHGKGGKTRNVPISNNDARTIEVLKKATPGERVFSSSQMKSVQDIHSYRREYVQNMYMKEAEPIEAIKGEKMIVNGKQVSRVYTCRKDGKGYKLDRKAMLKVSKWVGHNRVSVMAGHYIL